MENIPKDSCFIKFQEILVASLIKILGEDYSMESTSILKNNSMQLEGIIISKINCNMSPTIYLNEYYNQYIYGKDMYEIVHEVIHDYKEAMLRLQKNELELNYDRDYLRKCVVYRIVSMKHNKILLDTLPHIPYLDLAITFHCMVQCSGDELGSIRITYELLHHLELSLNELHELACKNTITLLRPSLRPMKQVIDSLIQYEKGGNGPSGLCDIEESHGYFSFESEKASPYDMYVLTNIRAINGASAILYPGLLKEIASKLESDLYILPSSIHEVIIIAKNTRYQKDELEYMVKEINESEVPIEDILSDRVYIYSRSLDGLHM